MEETQPLVAIIVVGIGLAFVFGTIATRLRISPIVGYLLAGVAVGPFTPGFVADPALAPQLAEIGVILLMFGVGLHFSLRDLLAQWFVVVPGALLQVTLSVLLGMGVAYTLGWSFGAAFALGLALSISSTVVLTRTLQANHLVDTERGHIAVAWLIVQDLITVVALVLLPPLALTLQAVEESAGVIDYYELALTFAFVLLRLVAFVALMLLVGTRLVPILLHYVAHTGSRELFRLSVLAIALGVAYVASQFFGVSLALGAFFAGMIMSESPLSQRAAEESLPLRDAFAVLFFVSIGMLFDPTVIVNDFFSLLATLLVVIIGNGGVAFLVMRVYRYSAATALTVGGGLAQIGEFSFILADLSIGLGLMDERGRDLVLGASILSIFFNPAIFVVADRFRRRFAPSPAASASDAPPLPEADDGLVVTSQTNHAVIVGCGRVGEIVCERLYQDGWPLVVIEDASDIVERLHSEHVEVIQGNAAEGSILAAANITGARILVVAIPNGFEAGQIVEQARLANPALEIIARAHFDAEVDHLLEHGANTVIMGEREIARSILEHAAKLAPPVRKQSLTDDAVRDEVFPA
jgi:CPA2 family monovalent cation:H+ antiporter-2